jgi:hypothetical protein
VRIYPIHLDWYGIKISQEIESILDLNGLEVWDVELVVVYLGCLGILQVQSQGT